MEEALAPQTDHIASHRERGGDLIIGATRGSEQDYLGAKYLEIWQRILPRAHFQHLALLP
jgi:hypothetical protein